MTCYIFPTQTRCFTVLLQQGMVWIPIIQLHCLCVQPSFPGINSEAVQPVCWVHEIKTSTVLFLRWWTGYPPVTDCSRDNLNRAALHCNTALHAALKRKRRLRSRSWAWLQKSKDSWAMSCHNGMLAAEHSPLSQGASSKKKLTISANVEHPVFRTQSFDKDIRVARPSHAPDSRPADQRLRRLGCAQPSPIAFQQRDSDDFDSRLSRATRTHGALEMHSRAPAKKHSPASASRVCSASE